MKIRLRKMNVQEYGEFYDHSAGQHVQELMRELGLSREEAVREAEKELREMLPDGRDTEGSHLMVIEAPADEATVGYIWFMYEWTDGLRQVFLCDLEIREPARRRGFAAAALSEMEELAAGDRCKESVLFVANENTAAQNLYKKCGYALLRTNGYGMYLKKALRIGI